MSAVPCSPIQSTPILGFSSLTWEDLALDNVYIGSNPEFSDNAWGTTSKASAKALIAYYSTEETLSAS